MGLEERTPEQVLADKVNLLLDALPGEDGKPLKFADVQEGLRERGVYLGRTMWHYLKTADPRSKVDRQLLTALAEVFGVDPGYLLHEEGPLPAKVEQELQMLRAMQRAKVRNFAARALGQIDPEALQAILEVIDRESDASESSEQGSKTDE